MLEEMVKMPERPKFEDVGNVNNCVFNQNVGYSSFRVDLHNFKEIKYLMSEGNLLLYSLTIQNEVILFMNLP